MLTLQYLRENKEESIQRLKLRNIDASSQVEDVLTLDTERRKLQKTLDDMMAQSNQIAKSIGSLFQQGKKEEAEGLKAETADLKEKSKAIQERLETIENQINTELVKLPNTPSLKVKAGKTPEDNEVVLEEANISHFEDGLMPHWDLAKKYDLIDFEVGNKITGAGFPVYKGKGARLQRALINYFLEKAIAEGYTEYEPPILVNETTAYSTGQLPDKEGQMYFVGVDNLYLIPTAEVPLTNIYRDVILKPSDLPVKLTGFTPCFRREAGSYGKDVRGLNRLHQFDKVEVVQIVDSATSYETLEKMKDYVAGLLRELGLPFRILRLCGGDMGFTSAMTYDLEVFSGAQKKWLEVSSCSNFETFQSNRLKLRYKDDEGKIHLLHTLNGSALALPRIVAALLENNQEENRIKIPAVLWPYTGFKEI